MVFLDVNLARLTGRSMQDPERQAQDEAASFGNGKLLKVFGTCTGDRSTQVHVSEV